MKAEDEFTKKIAGEVTLSDSPGAAMKKWRQIFGFKQSTIASKLSISPSVVSDYESGRRKNPGAGFIKQYITALVKTDKEAGGQVVSKFSSEEKNSLINVRELLTPLPAKKLLEFLDAKVIAYPQPVERMMLGGVSVIDSLTAILELSENDFTEIYGSTMNRALIFTGVSLGRSPLVAVKVTSPKPSLIVLHGLNPNAVDKLAIKIAESIKVPLAVSQLKQTNELIDTLREHLT
ncbi:MAG: helix-turn-helix domain-containing protein [Candidatus Altiarchaeales archaeon]|nr:helix-turn-helix domain-containing protein [Candidatus Altiarchaeales archaeon]